MKQPGSWTTDQQTAITTIDRPLLVSAAAGSGKTSVLAERCVHLVCDVSPETRCDVNQLLVVTFTRAAAAEMRQRIEAGLRARTGEVGDRRLLRQIQLLDTADISTLHSFATRVLRRHFSVAGIDPAFTTLDEADALLLRIEVCRRVIQKAYEGVEGERVSDFVERYCQGSDDRLRGHVLRVFDLRNSTVDPAVWSDSTLKRLDETGATLRDTALGRALLLQLEEELSGFIRRARLLETYFAASSQKYAGHTTKLRETYETWQASLRSAGFSGLRELVQRYDPKAHRAPADRDCSQILKDSLAKLKTDVTNSLARTAAGFTEVQLLQSAVDTLAPVGVLMNLVDAFEAEYSRAKRILRALDFSDLERLTLRVLTDRNDATRPSPAAMEYRGQYEHVMVDEYQDINALQDRILQLVSRPPGESGGGNLFCVGDVKQSIYRFRLADPTQFLQREALYRRQDQAGTVVTLAKNFRSDAGIVHTINALFRRLMTAATAEIDYDASQELHVGKSKDRQLNLPIAAELHLLPDTNRSGPPDQDNPGGAPDSRVGPIENAGSEESDEGDRTEREADFAGALIQQHCSPQATHRFDFGQIAILLRARTIRAEKFANRLRRLGIPVAADSTTGFFDAVEIRDVLSLLHCLDNPRQDVPLAALLRSPLAQIQRPDDILARIRVQFPSLPFHEAAFRFARESARPESAVLLDFLDKLETWRLRALQRPLAGVLWEIISESGFLAFCAAMPDGRQRVANLLALHDRARSFGDFSRQGLHRFLQFLQALREEKDLGLPPSGDEPGNVVRIMSIHASKGLQFPVVIIPELGKRFNLADSSGLLVVDREQHIAAQQVDLARRARWPSLSSLVAKGAVRRQLLAEEMRVLYVGMTRAENKLILTGTANRRAPGEVLDQWRAEWRGHSGPLPADLVLSASSMLDWLGPAAVCDEIAGSPLQLHAHDRLEEFEKPAMAPGKDFHAVAEEVLSLQPLPGAAAPSDQTSKAVALLGWQPPSLALAHAPAARAVTQLTKAGRTAPAGESPSLRPLVKFNAPLPPPRFAHDSKAAKPTDIGNATHRALQAMPLGIAPSPAAVAKEVERLCDRRLLSEADAKLVDIEAIAWFVSTPFCQRLTAPGVTLYRELPVFAPEAVTRAHPFDRAMLRGQIDVLAAAPDGLLLADYKTDRVTKKTLTERVEFYRPQVNLYREMIRSIAGQPVSEAVLIFLTARQVVTVEPDDTMP